MVSYHLISLKLNPYKLKLLKQVKFLANFNKKEVLSSKCTRPSRTLWVLD